MLKGPRSIWRGAKPALTISYPSLPFSPLCRSRPPLPSPVSTHPILPSVQVQAPLVDLEVRGIPALQYFGEVVWKDVYESMNAGV